MVARIGMQTKPGALSGGSSLDVKRLFVLTQLEQMVWCDCVRAAGKRTPKAKHKQSTLPNCISIMTGGIPLAVHVSLFVEYSTLAQQLSKWQTNNKTNKIIFGRLFRLSTPVDNSGTDARLLDRLSSKLMWLPMGACATPSSYNTLPYPKEVVKHNRISFDSKKPIIIF